MENSKQSYYMIIPASVWNNKDLTQSEIMLYGHISTLAQKEGHCFASNKYFRGVTGKSDATIYRMLNNLEQNGLIIRENIYVEGKKLIEKRKIYLVSPMKPDSIMDETSPGIMDETSPGIIDDTDNSTRDNNTRDNNKNSEKITREEKVFNKLKQIYPKNRINSPGPVLKYLKTLDTDQLKKVISNAPRYLKMSQGYIKNLRNYLEHECWTDEWYEAEQKNKQQKNGINNTDVINNAESFKNRNKSFYD